MQTAVATTVVAEPRTAAYAIDPAHASAQFKVRHLMIAHVRGELGEVAGDVVLDQADLARSSVVARVDATAIDTRNPDRDAHLRSADFLDVANHPALTFRSTEVRPDGRGRLEVAGELTIRGVTRPVTLGVELSDEIRDPWGNAKRGVTATARLDRRDFGLTWNAALETGGLVVGDAVEVTIEAELVRRA
ncbi:MAG TPA: YceI family protein [Anaeromyxobacteraceae bacterium]|nr:YceI family protein [Anaeromyxobacteraceae bacterium]